MLKTLSLFRRFSTSIFPKIEPYNQSIKNINQLRVITQEQIDSEVPENYREEFKKGNKISIPNHEVPLAIKTIYLEKSARKVPFLSKDTHISFSPGFLKKPSFIGIASNIFAQGHKFSRKSESSNGAKLYYDDFQNQQYVLELAQSKIRSRQMADSRGDEATTGYF